MSSGRGYIYLLSCFPAACRMILSVIQDTAGSFNVLRFLVVFAFQVRRAIPQYLRYFLIQKPYSCQIVLRAHSFSDISLCDADRNYSQGHLTFLQECLNQVGESGWSKSFHHDSASVTSAVQIVIIRDALDFQEISRIEAGG